MTRNDPLGSRMKAYETATPTVIPASSAYVIRLDGRSFHRYTRTLARPFDTQLAHDLDAAAATLCADVDGSRLAYLQSDECSVVVSRRGQNGGHWFAGTVQKIASVSASLFTAQFVSARGNLAQFDARVIALPDDELRTYLCWRQADARRNAISMVASTHFSHRQLHQISTSGRRQMLTDHGVDLEGDYDPRDLAGRLVYRDTYHTDVTYRDRRTGRLHTVEDVTRSRWIAEAAPSFRTLADVPHLSRGGTP